MTWRRYKTEKYKDMKVYLSIGDSDECIIVAPFVNDDTGEYRFFGSRKLEEIGEIGILKLLNSPIPASSQSGE